MSDGRVEFDIVGNTRGIRSAIDEATSHIEQQTRKWDDAAEEASDGMESKFSSALKKIVAGFSAIKIGKALLDFGKDAIQAASDLEEVQNVVDTTFGKQGAAQIQSWADQASKSFGLTETQAKKFTSTLGAMMKSAGMAGPEIVTMSTDLAGLAADMASFYNLDFETAFQKIRSGISGETEPLKQLGINMSVANLEAYALSKGISKAFNDMSQGEQTMLRYQYLMQATADAQGDFARTSNGYANSVRILENNLTSLKTNLGTVLLDVINPLLTGINSLFPQGGGDRHSILDDLADIQIKKEQKLAEIREIKTVADELIRTLGSLASDATASNALTNISESANKLDASSVSNWQAVLQSLQGIDGLQNLFNSGDNAVDTVEDLAAALAGDSVTMSKAQAWQTFLSALSDNADAVAQLTGKSAGDTAAWLHELSEAAGELSPEDAGAWNTLLSTLLSGLGEGEGEESKRLVDLLAQNFLALGTDSADAVNGLLALGLSTDDIAEKQAAWLEVCRELVRQMPGLSSIIDTNTGKIKGGLPALKQYADDWERAAKYQAEIEAIREMRELYGSDNYKLYSNTVKTRGLAKAKLQLAGYTDTQAEKLLNDAKQIIGEYIEGAIADGLQPDYAHISNAFNPKTAIGTDIDTVSSATLPGGAFALYSVGIDPKRLDALAAVSGDAEEALMSYVEAEYDFVLYGKEAPIVLQTYTDAEKALAEEYDTTTEAIEEQTEASGEAAKSMTTLEKAAQGDADATEQVTNAVNNANEALKAMADYAENVHKAVESSVNNTVKGFSKVESSSQTAKDKASDLAKKLADMGGRTEKNAAEWDRLNAQIQEYNSQTVTAKGMKEGLQSQLDFMEDYLAAFEAAKAMNLSTDMLSFLADGSMESYEWLKELTDPQNAQAAGEISKKWDEVQQKKKSFTDTLAGEQLSMDETFAQLQAKAAEAVAALDLQGEAAENTGKTIQGIAEGISNNVPTVASAVDSILAELNRLNSFGININLGDWGSISWFMPDIASNAKGLDYVPFDGYLSELHEGEGILTAEENRVWQNFKRGGMTTRNTDYDTLGSVIGDNTHTGGNVYLEGRVVGQVISDVQGRSYRSLKRSGWKS